MSGLNYKKLGSTFSNICNTTQLDDATKCHYAFKNFWGEPCSVCGVTEIINNKFHNRINNLVNTQRKLLKHSKKTKITDI